MRVTRSFVFLDLCGFTAYTESHGDREAVAIVAMLRATLRASAEEHGVRVTKWLGDGAMLSGTDARRVAACAVEVRDAIAHQSPLPVRGGLAAGPVIMFEGDDYIGAAVNTAARLAAAAAPNQLLTTAALAHELRGLIAAGPPRQLAVRGLTGVIDVCALRAALFDEGTVPTKTTQLPRVVGA